VTAMTGRVAALRSRGEEMTAALARLVAADTPTGDLDQLARGAGEVARAGAEIAGPPALLERGGIRHLRWGPARPRVLLLGHYDTVWPAGTPARRPPELRDGRLHGPGAFDMKAGIVQGLHALRDAGADGEVAFLVTGDEERGAPTSGELIDEHAAGAAAVLVLEPSADGALKTARHGVAQYELTVHGRAAHAGLDPEKGVNALVELAAAIGRLVESARALDGITLTPSVAHAGTAANVVPALASCAVDVRARTAQAQQAADALVAGLEPLDPHARIEWARTASCPPLEAERSAALFALAQEAAGDLGLGPLRGVEVGGGSDGNRTAARGVPTLDGLGAVGDGAHADHEHVVVDAMPARAALVAELIARLTA